MNNNLDEAPAKYDYIEKCEQLYDLEESHFVYYECCQERYFLSRHDRSCRRFWIDYEWDLKLFDTKNCPKYVKLFKHEKSMIDKLALAL
jgi:hypothetical protein